MANILTNPFVMGAIVLGAGVYLLWKGGIIESVLGKRYNPGSFEEIEVLTPKEAQKAIKKAEVSEDPFTTLSKELSDDDDVDKKLKSLLER